MSTFYFGAGTQRDKKKNCPYGSQIIPHAGAHILLVFLIGGRRRSRGHWRKRRLSRRHRRKRGRRKHLRIREPGSHSLRPHITICRNLAVCDHVLKRLLIIRAILAAITQAYMIIAHNPNNSTNCFRCNYTAVLRQTQHQSSHFIQITAENGGGAATGLKGSAAGVRQHIAGKLRVAEAVTEVINRTL